MPSSTRCGIFRATSRNVPPLRGSPAGGAYLSFQHVPESDLRRAFGPVIDTLAANGIDLKKRPIEVAPIAHYHMGGVKVDARFESAVVRGKNNMPP